MRVIAGSARNHKLFSLKGIDIRPTADRVKEAVFSSLGQTVTDARVLDLFAGSGAIGIEALSRGAKFCVFVDSSYECVQLIKQNLTHTKLSDKSKIIHGDAFGAIKSFSVDEQFDIIYIDPPYGKGLIVPALEKIIQKKILAPGGTIVAECGRTENVICPPGLGIIKQKVYGAAKNLYIVAADTE